jgi:RND family efflux transporter MFP subunit
MKKLVFLLLLAGLLGLLGWLIWRRLHEQRGGEGDKPGRGKATTMAVEVAAIRRGPIRDVRMFTGTLEPRASYVVAPKIGGRLESLAVKLGDPVAPGNLIAQLDDEEYRQQVAQAEAAVEVAKATVEQQQTSVDLAERERERIRRLRERQATSEAAWDAADAEYKIQSARHKVAMAQRAEQDAALKASRIRLSYTQIYLPQDAAGGAWFVADRHVDEGAMLSANAPMVTVVDLARVTAVIHVIERDYPMLKIGLEVAIETDAAPGERFPGTIIRIAPALAKGSRQARVEIDVPNEQLRLRPGMFARAFIEFARREEATLVPRGALVQRDGKPGVYLVDPTTRMARFVPVKVDIQASDLVSVADPGLSGSVVTLGHHLLSDGTAVIVANPATAPEPTPPGTTPARKAHP